MCCNWLPTRWVGVREKEGRTHRLCRAYLDPGNKLVGSETVSPQQITTLLSSRSDTRQTRYWSPFLISLVPDPDLQHGLAR